MSKIKWVGVLSTTERNSVGLIQVRQSNVNSEVFAFDVLDANGELYDFDGKKVFFCTYFDSFAPVEQRAIITAKGKIQYAMNDYDMQKPVRINFAYFKIVDDKNNLVDTTQNFAYDILPSIEKRCMNSEPYIIRLEELLDSFANVKDEATKEIQDIIKDFNDRVIDQQQEFENWFDSMREVLESIDPGGILLNEIITARDSEKDLNTRLDRDKKEILDRLNEYSLIQTGEINTTRTLIDDNFSKNNRNVKLETIQVPNKINPIVIAEIGNQEQNRFKFAKVGEV